MAIGRLIYIVVAYSWIRACCAVPTHSLLCSKWWTEPGILFRINKIVDICFELFCRWFRSPLNGQWYSQFLKTSRYIIAFTYGWVYVYQLCCRKLCSVAIICDVFGVSKNVLASVKTKTESNQFFKRTYKMKWREKGSEQKLYPPNSWGHSYAHCTLPNSISKTNPFPHKLIPMAASWITCKELQEWNEVKDIHMEAESKKNKNDRPRNSLQYE